jgi:hypothetical protein
MRDPSVTGLVVRRTGRAGLHVLVRFRACELALLTGEGLNDLWGFDAFRIVRKAGPARAGRPAWGADRGAERS